MREGLLIGGPLDGARLAPKARGVCAWVGSGGGSRGTAGYATPGPRRVLYRSVGFAGEHELWLFAGHTHALCSSCGGLNELSDPARAACQLCGEALVRLSDRIVS